jgi:aryl-phospho-beta-D-glucosidase BglC (GH1 family)
MGAAVNLSFVLKSTTETFLGTCLGVLASSCLTPPAAKTASGSEAHLSTVASADRPHDLVDPPAGFLANRIGWNLGNSLDVPDGETAWGNPKVTPELMSAVAKAGFGLVRIPITWTRHTGLGPACVIEPSWLERVAEVVGYARSAGLHSIINLHHDGADGFKGVAWLTLKDSSGKTTEENDAAVGARFLAVWTQIAKHFADYGEELLFESMNEIHDGYGPPDPRHFAIINELNQKFVNLIRATGGKNAKRYLVVPGYNTNIDHTIKGFRLPTDSAANRLILSVHYYDPYLFALQGKTHTWGSASPDRDNWGQEDFVVAQFDKLKSTFIDQGVPVLLGEYGATHQARLLGQRRSRQRRRTIRTH